MDLGLKPSLTAYFMRPDGYDPKRPSTNSASPQQQAAKDKDEGLLALVDRQVQIAAGKLKTGNIKQALSILRRCYDLALSHPAPSPNGERPLVQRLTISLVRIQMCAALSHLERHEQALEEATLAKRELDELWVLMTGATLELEAAQAVGDTSMPHPVLRHHILHPPSWLSRTVEASVQARLCVAVEMEYMLPIEAFEAALEAAHIADMGLPPRRAPGAARPGSKSSSKRPGTGVSEGVQSEVEELPPIGQPIPALSNGQELFGLYHEALRLSNKLLPKSNAVRKDAERTAREARQRWKDFTGLASAPVSPDASQGGSGPLTSADDRPMTTGFEKPSRPGTAIQDDGGGLSRPGTAAVEALPVLPMDGNFPEWSPELVAEADADSVFGDFGQSLARMPKGSRMKAYEMAAVRSPGSRPTSVGASTRLPDELAEFSGQALMYASTDSFGSAASTHSEWVRTAPPGDVFYRSWPANFIASGGGSMYSDASSRKSKKKKKRSSGDAAPQVAQEVQDPDPFKDWQKNYMDVGNMTLFQRKLLTLEGMSSLQHDMKTESRRFKHFMQDLSALDTQQPDEMRLTDDRIVYTDHGMLALQIGQQKSQAVKKKAWHPSAQGQRMLHCEKEMFEYYNISPPPPGKEVNVKHLRKLMKESFDRTPAEVARKTEEEEKMNRIRMEEAEKKRQEMKSTFGGIATKPAPDPAAPAARKRGSTMARGSVRGSISRSAPDLKGRGSKV